MAFIFQKLVKFSVFRVLYLIFAPIRVKFCMKECDVSPLRGENLKIALCVTFYYQRKAAGNVCPSVCLSRLASIQPCPNLCPDADRVRFDPSVRGPIHLFISTSDRMISYTQKKIDTNTHRQTRQRPNAVKKQSKYLQGWLTCVK